MGSAWRWSHSRYWLKLLRRLTAFFPIMLGLASSTKWNVNVSYCWRYACCLSSVQDAIWRCALALRLVSTRSVIGQCLLWWVEVKPDNGDGIIDLVECLDVSSLVGVKVVTEGAKARHSHA